MKKIYIDPGHGGEAIGASYNGRKEQDDCLRLSLAVKAQLLTQKGVEVMLSREDDTNPDIMDRAKEANEWGADYFISIHRNAFTPNKAKGVEAWCYSKCAVGGATYNKAEKIVKEICAATDFVDRGVKLGAPSYADFGVNRYTEMSSCLLETGFVDSDSDNAIFDKQFDKIAKAIAKSIYESNVGKWVDKPTKTEEKTQAEEDGLVYLVQVGAFSKKANAEACVEKAKKAGFADAFIAVKGDMDGDGKITAADSREVTRASVGLK